MVNMPRNSRVQRISWGDESENVSGGEIRARTNHQLLSHSSTKTDRKLGISAIGENSDSESTLVRNGFDSQIIAVAFRTESCGKDEVWMCENLLPGDAKKGKKTTLKNAASALRRSIRARGESTVFASEKQSRRNRNTNNDDIESSSIGQSLEMCMNLQHKNLGYLLDARDGAMKYIAVTESCDNFQMPIPNAKIESNIHVIIGEY
jgi:hypothetical protein